MTLVYVDESKTTGHIPVMPRASLREQLLSAGVETLHRKGFNATSVQDITDAAGAPKGSFYNHFASKEALAAEAVRRYREKGRERLTILQDPRLKPLRRLRTLCRYMPVRHHAHRHHLPARGQYRAEYVLGVLFLRQSLPAIRD